MTEKGLPVGKLPPLLLQQLVADAPVTDPDVLLGPGIGLDCAVVRHGGRLLVFKSDPITFATDEAGWYLVQVNVNDIATTGATPRWLMLTMLLPEGQSDRRLVERLSQQVYDACSQYGISVVGGHTEVTFDLPRPILLGTLIGEVEEERLVTPEGIRPGDALLLTKGVPIEGTAIIAREFGPRLRASLLGEELEEAAGYLYEPGIGVWHDAQTALAAGRVTAMHDPTEGGLAAALWELAEAGQCVLEFAPALVPISDVSRKICRIMGIDPLATIASGALLLSARPQDADAICRALQNEGIPCAVIGQAAEGQPAVLQQMGSGLEPFPRPERDEIARLFESDQ